MTAAALDLFSRQPLPIGERWKIDRGDATAWLGEIAAESVDCIVTDPAYESLEKHRAKGTTTRLKVSAASSNEWFPIFENARFPAFFAEVYRVLRRDTHFYMFCDHETAFVAKPLAEAAGFKFWKPLIWDKKRIGMGYHYRSRYEMILFFEKGKRRLNDLGIADIIECPRVSLRRKCCCEEELAWADGSTGAEGSPPRDTSRSQPSGDTGSSTCSCGSASTGPCPKGCRSTTRTRTSRTTSSTTSSSSTRRPTSASTRDASCEMASGGSPVAVATSSSPSTESTGTSTRTGAGRSSGVARPATSAPSSNESDLDAWRLCPACGQARGAYATEKPVGVSEILIRQSTEPGDIVVDPFAGSASVGEAALKVGRRFAGCDVKDGAVDLGRARLGGIS